MRRILPAFAFALAAPLVFYLALSNATILVFMNGGSNGFQRAILALNYLVVTDAQRGTVDVRMPGIALAREAYAREPLATDALFALAVADQHAGKGDRARQVVERGLGLNKRDARLRTLVLQRQIGEGNVRGVLLELGRITQVRPDMADPMVHGLAPIVKNDAFTPLLEQALAKKPVWADAFWAWAPIEPANLPNLVRLRQRTAVGTTNQSDDYLVKQLAANGHYAEAFEVLALSGRTSLEPGAFFASFPNLGWQPAPDANFSARLEAGRSLAVYAKPGAAGILGRTLLQLRPGRYQLAFKPSDAALEKHLRFGLKCANGLAADAAFPLAEATSWTVPAGECRAYWLAFGAETWDNSLPLVGQLESVTLNRSGSSS